jgi:hypothetical protein
MSRHNPNPFASGLAKTRWAKETPDKEYFKQIGKKGLLSQGKNLISIHEKIENVIIKCRMCKDKHAFSRNWILMKADDYLKDFDHETMTFICSKCAKGGKKL